jgi:hypothetical protein
VTLRIWEAYAMRYATVRRRRSEIFIAQDLHDEDTDMDYFVWFLTSGDETIRWALPASHSTTSARP